MCSFGACLICSTKRKKMIYHYLMENARISEERHYIINADHSTGAWKLNRSKFRASFHLTQKDREYIRQKGMEVILSHAEDFVKQKLAPAEPVNDGKQTPMHGHPVFKAMHATACCCRGCLYNWYKVPMHRQLTDSEQQRIVNLLMAWIESARSN